MCVFVLYSSSSSHNAFDRLLHLSPALVALRSNFSLTSLDSTKILLLFFALLEPSLHAILALHCSVRCSCNFTYCGIICLLSLFNFTCCDDA